MCRANRTINYNPNAIRPFLCKPLPNPGKYLKGQAVYARADEYDPEYYFHATTLSNFRGILKQGLLSSHGSIGGAGQILANGRFKKNEIGYICVTNSPYAVDRYIYGFDNEADNILKEDEEKIDTEGNITCLPILLRFKPLPNEVWIQDPCDSYAFKTKSNIAPYRLDFLSFEGWVSLQEKECRDKIISIIGEILN